MKKKILFLCTHNAARSQMAEGILRSLYGDRFEVFSAGNLPTRVHAYAISVMQELGIDISNHTSKSVELFKDRPLDYVITVCDRVKETCPFLPNVQNHLHWSLMDPAETVGTADELLRAFRSVRDDLKRRIIETVEKIQT